MYKIRVYNHLNEILGGNALRSHSSHISKKKAFESPGRKTAWQGSQVSRQLVGVIHPVCLHRCVKLAHTVVMLLTVCPVNQISNNSQSFVEVKVNNANYPLLKLTIALVHTVSEIKHMTRDFDSRFSRRRVLDNCSSNHTHSEKRFK